MKTSIFLPLAFEFDPKERLAVDAFGFTDREKFSLLRAIGERVNNVDEEDLPLPHETFMELRNLGLVPDGLLIHLAAYGLKCMWDDYADGILLMLDAEKEKEVD
jgi:hypothetical protein